MRWIFDDNSPNRLEIDHCMQEIVREVTKAVHVYGDDPDLHDETALRLVRLLSGLRKESRLGDWPEAVRASCSPALVDVVARKLPEIVRAGVAFEREEDRRWKHREARTEAATIPRPQVGKHFQHKLASAR